jgi:UPF0271 protein
MPVEYKHIDINADVGERPGALLDGSEERLLRLVTSANIACGSHAGDASSMLAVVKMCLSLGVSIGAHPGYPDKAGFGRSRLPIPPSELERSLVRQLVSLIEVASLCGATVRHVKPHGALYNAAMSDGDLASTIARAVAAVDPGLKLVGLAGSPALDLWRGLGFTVVAEAFADRRYEADATLRSRSFPDALIVDPDEAAKQVLLILLDGCVISVDGSKARVAAQSICIHGDTPGAHLIASVVRKELQRSGVTVEAL